MLSRHYHENRYSSRFYSMNQPNETMNISSSTNCFFSLLSTAFKWILNNSAHMVTIAEHIRVNVSMWMSHCVDMKHFQLITYNVKRFISVCVLVEHAHYEYLSSIGLYVCMNMVRHNVWHPAYNCTCTSVSTRALCKPE